MADADGFKPVVVAPTFNNARTLARILRAINALGLPVIVVNDGCTDGSDAILEAWLDGRLLRRLENNGSNEPDGAASAAARVAIPHDRNRGKAAALVSGFARALEMGFSHAVTIDTDGQLDPGEIPALLLAARAARGSLVLGSRALSITDCPLASRLGRRISNLLVKWESGACLTDSQCGFRVYPLRQTTLLRCHAARYGYETEVLTRAAWAGIAIEQPPVGCIYDLSEGRVTHFSVGSDSLSGALMHVRLLAVSLLPLRIMRMGTAPSGTMMRRFLQWISPIRAWRTLRCEPSHRPRFAAALAAGVFIANLPLFGMQTLLSLYTAKRFRLNPVACVLGSYISTPPIGPVLIGIAIALGHWVRFGALLPLTSFDRNLLHSGARLGSILVDWTIGGMICGTAMALMTFVIMRFVFQRVPVRRQEDPAIDRRASAPGHAPAALEPTV